MIARGKVSYVISHTVVDMDISLAFGIHVSKRVWLDGVPPTQENEDQKKKASHCAVLLLGGKKVLVNIPSNETAGRTIATLYREFDEETLKRFDNVLKDDIVVDGSKITVINVNRFLQELSSSGFPVDYVKGLIIS